MKVISTLLVMFFASVVMAAPVHNIVVFGDSLSDNGNLYEFMQHRMPLSPPYYKGRFTNGPVWVERLANIYYPGQAEEHLLDYAFGGAGISMEEGEDDEALFTLKHELETYLLSHNDKADPDSLFIVWIGSNNYLAIPDEMSETVAVVNKGIARELEKLAKKGARHVLVMNLPNLGHTPAAREFDAEEMLTQAVVLHNARLLETLSGLKAKYPKVEWLHFDTFQQLEDIMADPAQRGFTNTTDTCYDEIIEKPSQLSVLKMVASVKKPMQNAACEGYMFFDPIHSTALSHQIMAEQVYELLEKSGVKFVQ